MTTPSPSDRLTAVLVTAGYPVQCVSQNADNTFNVTLTSAGTAAQAAAIQTFLLTYVDTPAVLLPLSTIVANIEKLNNSDQMKLLSTVAAIFIQQNPQIASVVGINITGT